MLSLSIYVFAITQAIGSTYYMSTNSRVDYMCGDGADICDIHCDVSGGGRPKETTFHCNHARQCNFYCERRKCAENANIIATNCSNLHIIVSDNGDECMKNSIIQTPDHGNATFDVGNSNKGFRGMQVYAGSNTQNIIIDVNSTNVVGDDCKEMQVYASTAVNLYISLGKGIEWENGILQCPKNTYIAPIAPCMIYGSDAVLLNTQIIANDGMPGNIWIDPGIIYLGINTLTCNAINGTITTSIAPFDTNSECWFTLQPTILPTQNPTNLPSFSSTISSLLISMFPSKVATMPPTKYPTYAPSRNHSNSTYYASETHLTNVTVITYIWCIIAILMLFAGFCGCARFLFRHVGHGQQREMSNQMDIAADALPQTVHIDTYDTYHHSDGPGEESAVNINKKQQKCTLLPPALSHFEYQTNNKNNNLLNVLPPPPKLAFDVCDISDMKVNEYDADEDEDTSSASSSSSFYGQTNTLWQKAQYKQTKYSCLPH